MGTWLTNAKPYLMLLAVQFGSAGMFILAMDAIKKGMSHYVFIVYRNAIASITLAPFAFVLESIVGAIVVVLGLYLVVWGKSKERKGQSQMLTSPVEDNSQEDQCHLPVTAPSNDNKA
uniref:WAT1-related protein n=1 Tax=Cajanus cajan TaxID=3821 RepID=A0A151SK56_CAJCA|nr:hypothetical protein KK1_001370 [Cajanus cajan]